MVPKITNLKDVTMKKYKILLFVLLIIPALCFSQKKAKDSIVEKPARPAFESRPCRGATIHTPPSAW